MKRLLFYLLFGYAIWLSWQHLFGQPATASPNANQLSQTLKQQFVDAARSASTVRRLDNAQPAAALSCDGRIYCSQMHSRAEAQFFLENCPNTRMDGDHDGLACERDSRW